MLELHDGIKINVKIPAGKLITFDVQANEPVKNVKSRIYEKEGISVVQQQLIFAGKELEDDRTLSDYHITSNCTISVLMHRQASKEKCVRVMCVNIQMKAIEQYFYVALFLMLYKTGP
ncbi:hypothetical protein ACROYT_G035968 [Oculina patagonica]